MVTMAKQFDFAAVLERAKPKIKQIWNAGTLDTPNANYRAKNLITVKAFFWEEYCEDYFTRLVGFNQVWQYGL